MPENLTFNYPRDTERKRLFVPESSEHQAKLEIRTYKELVNLYTNEGDTILDPMSGIGTVHLAATMGRNTVAIELVPRFVELQHLNIEHLNKVLGINATTTVLEGDCRRWLPLPNALCSFQPTAVIFSPPYGDLWKVGADSKFHQEKHINIGYDTQVSNVGQITVYPTYLAAMRNIYKLCYQSLPSGAPMIVVTKDYVKGGQRVYLAKDTVKLLLEVGFAFEAWHQRVVDPRIFQIIHNRRREQQGNVDLSLRISAEDILVFRK